MSDLISKEALMQTLQNEHCCGCDLYECCDEDDCYMGEIFQAVRSAPAIEAIPVEWVQKQMSECVSYSIVWVVLRDLLREWERREDG